MLAFVDTETTGLHPEDHEIWEFAGLKFPDVESVLAFDASKWPESFGPAESLHLYIEVDLSTADGMALTLNGFWKRSPQSPMTPFSGGLHDKYLYVSHVVGMGPTFDAERLARLLRAESQTPTWHYHIVNVEDLTLGFGLGKGWPFEYPWKSDDLFERFLGPKIFEGLDEEVRHTAKGDVLLSIRVFQALHEDGAVGTT